MILYFLLDYVVMFFTPFRSYFVVYDIDKQSVLEVLLIGLAIDWYYHKFLFVTITLLLLHFLFKKFPIENYYVKNIVSLTLFFHISFFLFGMNITNYLWSLGVSLVGLFLFCSVSKYV